MPSRWPASSDRESSLRMPSLLTRVNTTTTTGNLFVGSATTNFNLSALAVGVSGTGNVQFAASTLTLANSLTGSVTGTGNVAIMAKAIAVKDTVAVDVTGVGNVYIQSEKLTASSLATKIAGTGNATFSRGGSVQQQSIVVSGVGDVSSGSIVAVDTNITITGTGNVVVQTSGKLQVASEFASEVHYFGATPSSITSTSLDDKVPQVTESSYRKFEAKPLPTRQPVLISIEITASSSSSEPKVKNLYFSDNGDGASASSPNGSQSQAGRTGLPSPGITVFVGLTLTALCNLLWGA